ncbi:SDR family NAD(P)-dependent oxidoreductase [Lederbergia galactosidilytica]|uniref:NADH-ubiquinone oxidoreductase n=1 Tax=Lederbergia galactosidilytica TaxID=217031 RepID=A0A177ZH86_9BACI|nr:SDR family NAD(P)-dependent oxidoreductase [Lederbergia galactosidilytica]KRG16444.1 NADH-ubiquinone oxidoreductase [Virgibacillus soli]OAK67321.1 NADH-ubiquinone oxidoreductase [Lederbergia galactosidilytica]
MKKVLVLGASGGMGYALVQELVQRGIEVKAFARSEQKLKALFGHQELVKICTGDIFNLNELLSAAEQVDTIFQSANLPYEQWDENLLPFFEKILQVAKTVGAKLVLVENIYAYGRSIGSKVTEDTPKRPHTKKGEIRLQVEKRIKNSNVQALFAHLPDFYGPNAENTLLHITFKNVIQHKKSLFVGSKKVAREFIYTPDGAKALVNLALQDKAFGQNWNIPGYDVITGEEILQIIREINGYKKPVFPISKGIVKLAGLFDPTMREVVEMFYLNEDPVVLDGAKYEREIGPLPRTSYQVGIKQTLEYMLL